MLPRVRHEVENSPTLFCLFHPGAEEVERTLVDPGHLAASANTSTVGPGYHVFLASMLQDWAQDFGATWERSLESSEEYGDETAYFFTGDEALLFERMECWLQALANSFFDGTFGPGDRGTALCMPMNPHFETDTARSPRSRLAEVSRTRPK